MDWRVIILLNFTRATNGCPSSRLLSARGMRIVVWGIDGVWRLGFGFWSLAGAGVAGWRHTALTITLTQSTALFDILYSVIEGTTSLSENTPKA
jgi:hypothetical protein